MRTILIADDEKNMRWALKRALNKFDYTIIEAEDGEQAVEMFRQEYPDLVLLDVKMPKIDGMEALKEMMSEREGVPVIVMTAHGSFDSAKEAIKYGALDYIIKPFDLDKLIHQVNRALDVRDLNVIIEEYKESLAHHAENGLVGKSKEMLAVHELINKVASSGSVVLITGESGTGKEVVADAIYSKSKRTSKAYIKVNCGAIPDNLIESELFGHEKGAFTGAISRKPGRFERANGGTLFLDEVGELSLDMQVKLLRILQNKEFERVGGTESIKVDVRIIAATNRNLHQMVKDGTFREDLYYRLNVVPIALPALRARKDDIVGLSLHFISTMANEMSRAIPEIDDGIWKAFLKYNWPGNIRELQNVIERMMILSAPDCLDVRLLPKEMTQRDADQNLFILPPEGIDLEMVERSFIVQALTLTSGNQTKAAKLLNVSRHTLLYRMDKFEIDASMFKH